MAKTVVVAGTRGIPDVSGGVETHVENLFPAIRENGYDVTVCCRSCYIPEEKRVAAYRGCALVYLDTPRKKSFEAIVHTFRSILYAKKAHADIIHIHAIGPALLIPYARLLGLKTVFTHHGPDYERQKWGALARFMLRSGERMGCRYAHRVIVISNVIYELVAKKYNRTDALIIPNGVMLPKPQRGVSYLDSLGIHPKKYILSVARFVEEKGLHDLIAAFSHLAPKDWQLVIAGDADHETEYSRKLKAIAVENKSIILTGYIKGDALAQIYWNAGLFVLPSYHEGLPIALLEAMSYNLPVLVSDIPPHREIALDSRCYFKTKDIEDLSIKIGIAISDSVNNTANYSTLIKEKYNWDKIAVQTCNVYSSMVTPD